MIQSMIARTRKQFSDQSHYFLLWSWSALVACLAQYVLKAVYDYPRHYHVWWITALCVVITAFFYRKDRRRSSVKTYVNETLAHIWIGMGGSFLVLNMVFARFGFVYCFPFFITLYGAGAFISGRVLRFAPLVWGGLAGWLLAITAVWFSFDVQILLAAAALLTCYIIPAHLLRIRYSHS